MSVLLSLCLYAFIGTCNTPGNAVLAARVPFYMDLRLPCACTAQTKAAPQVAFALLLDTQSSAAVLRTLATAACAHTRQTPGPSPDLHSATVASTHAWYRGVLLLHSYLTSAVLLLYVSRSRTIELTRGSRQRALHRLWWALVLFLSHASHARVR